MRRPRIACVTCRELPEPDPDEPLLRDAVEAAGGTYELVAWDGDPYAWRDADLVTPRSTWNYYENPARFLEWAEHADAASTLVNPLSVVRGNLHKRYLLDLERAGVPVVPTLVVERGEALALADVLRDRGWPDAVIKPAIGARSWRNRRVGEATSAEGQAHLDALVAERDVLIQPYLRAVEDHGERSLIWIDGVLTHSIRKEARFSDDLENVSDDAIAPPEGAAAIVDAAIGAIEGELLYARVDVVPDATGRLVVMELELIEPSLFFAQDADALARFADALVQRASSR